jgi:hypothetical protein
VPQKMLQLLTASVRQIPQEYFPTERTKTKAYKRTNEQTNKLPGL